MPLADFSSSQSHGVLNNAQSSGIADQANKHSNVPLI
jgi:hypothetical protein